MIAICPNPYRDIDCRLSLQAIEILKRSQTGMSFKENLYKKMLECNPRTDYHLYFSSRTPEERATVSAILELFLLEREYRRY